MINPETVQRIREAARIEEVIGEFLTLKKHGANYLACCPFHNEKTPSFNVNPVRGIFKCFGCGEAGDSVSFLMKHEHYSYPEALRYLAAKYHISIEEEKLSDEQQQRQGERDALFHLSEFAQKYFASNLFDSDIGRAIGLSYLHERGLSDAVIHNFGLGYCIDEWSNFTDYARRNGYADKALEQTGLTIFRDDGKCYDRFRGRVMFPIYSISGRVLGFSGRILSKEKQAAKYVNSPESDIYVKGNILYGLYQARQAISRLDKCYLVEGNVDVVSMHQSGITNTVASCGTALTTQQIKLIKRYSLNVTVLYDGDAAGIKATLKAVNLLFAEGMHVRTVLFPDGEDPDSYAQKYGSSQLQQYLEQHEENFLLYKLRVAGDAIRRDPIRKVEYENEAIATIALVTDPLERTEYIAQCASLFSIPEQTVSVQVAKTIANQRAAAISAQSSKQPTSAPLDDSASSSSTQPVSPPPAPFVSPAPTADQPHQALPDIHPCESQELKIVSILVCSGDKCIRDGRVADLIVNDILDDGLSFDNPIYQAIFDLYAHAVAAGEPLPDANFFAMSDNLALRNAALGMMIAPRQISDLWHQRDIFVPSFDDRLEMDVTESLLTFKVKKLKQRMDAVDNQLKSVSDPDKLLFLLSQKNELNKLHVLIAKDALHRICD